MLIRIPTIRPIIPMVGAASLSASTHQFDLWNSKNLAAISYFVFILFTIIIS